MGRNKNITRLLNVWRNLEAIEWVGECENPPCDAGKIWRPQSLGPTLFDKCTTCNGTGKITRPATLEEVVEVATRMLKFPVEWTFSAATFNLEYGEALTINGGILQVKEGI